MPVSGPVKAHLGLVGPFHASVIPQSHSPLPHFQHFTNNIANLNSMISAIDFTFEAPLPGWPNQSAAIANEHGTGVLLATMVRDTDWEMTNSKSGQTFMVYHTSDAYRTEMYTLNISKGGSGSGSD